MFLMYVMVSVCNVFHQNLFFSSCEVAVIPRVSRTWGGMNPLNDSVTKITCDISEIWRGFGGWRWILIVSLSDFRHDVPMDWDTIKDVEMIGSRVEFWVSALC